MTVKKPLCVDLDGTLVHDDVIMVALKNLLKRKPVTFARTPYWLSKGVTYFKCKVMESIAVDVSQLPYNEPLLAWIREEVKEEREVILVTGTYHPVAVTVGNYLGCFKESFGTTWDQNFVGKNKAAFLNARYGRLGYDYVGNSYRDLEVWCDSAKAIVVNAPKGLLKEVKRITNDFQVFHP